MSGRNGEVEIFAADVPDKFGNREDVDLLDMPNGHIQCTVENTYWCDHVAYVVKNGLDAEAFIERFNFDDTWNSEWIPIEVPMMPTENLWIPAQLTARKVGNDSMYQVTYQYDAFGEDEPAFVGFLNPGEGRNTLRSMFLNYLASIPTFDNAVCSASAHGPKAEALWQRDIRGTDNKKIFAQRLTVFLHNKCRFCLSGIGSSNNDDLIPDDERASPSPWG